MIKATTATMVFLALIGSDVHAQEKEPLLGGTVLDLVDKGGIVMILILIGSVIGLALAFERIVNLRRSRLCPKDVISSIRDAAKNGDVDAATSLLEPRNDPLARILKAGIQRKGQGLTEVEASMEAVGSKELNRLKRPVRPLAILASVMPLLGLLGTIIGMIATFNLLGDTSPADRVQKLAPGIGQALYTTAAGLCVSIPFVVLYHYLMGRVNRMAEEWSSVGTDLALALRGDGAAA